MRWIVFGLLTLAVIVLVSPGILGKLAERSLRMSISRAERDNDGLVVTEERFERGWFSAAGRHRVELEDGDLRPGNAGPGGDGERTPALIIDTRIDHGLLPVTSMSRDAGSLQPALASTVSTLSLDLGEGRIVELPGRLESRIGLTGATESHYALASGSLEHEGLVLEWRGADIRFDIDADASGLAYRGRIEPLGWDRDGRSSRLGLIEFEGHQRKTRFGFSTGETALRVADASLASPIGGASGFARLAFDARNELYDARMRGNASLELERLVVPELGMIDLRLDVGVGGLDAAILGRIREALVAARDAGRLGQAPGSAYSGIEPDLKSLLMAGATLTVDRFALALPQGDVLATLHFELPPSGTRDASWAGLLLALEASADVRLPAALLDRATAANPEQARSLIAMGILKREGCDYVLEAEYAQGLVTVNGAPMPLPPGLLIPNPPRVRPR